MKHSRSQASFSRKVAYGCAAVLSASLHALLLGSAFFGYAPRHLKTPLTEGAAQVSGDTIAGESLTMLVLPNDTSISSSDEPPEFMAATTAAARTLDSPTLISSESLHDPEPIIDGVDEGDDSAPKVGDQTGLAMLFGRYMGQVKARIERAWEYPGARSRAQFSCRVRIKQDTHGNVEEVTLQRCGSDPAWQISLVRAIQQASPLSAPPDEKVFTPLLTLNFDAHD